VDVARAPVITVLVQADLTGSKIYTMKKSQQISIGISDVQFDNVGGVTITMQVKSASALASAPVASILVTGINTITKPITFTGSGTTYTGSVTLENFIQNGGANASITVFGETASGTVYGEYTSLVMSGPAQNPTCASNDGMAVLNSWNSATALASQASLLLSPKINPDVPSTQAGILTTIGRCYDFRLNDGTKQFQPGITANLTLSYSDADIPTGIDESTLGLAYWDETNSKWSAEGIVGIVFDRTANTVTGNVTHFSAYAILAINAVPVITVESPKASGYADEDPLISVKMEDAFSGIAVPKVEIDGQDITATIIAVAASDGIDNNGNGLTDEQGGNVVNTADDESAFNLLTAVSARLVSRPPIKLAKGEHTIRITALNAQAKSSVAVVKFNVGNRLDFAEDPLNYPNPFNPRRSTTRIVSNITTEADVTVKIFDFAGNKVATLNKHIYGQTGPINEIEWNGYEETTNKYLADGVYFASIEAKNGTESVKKFLKIAVTSK